MGALEDRRACPVYFRDGGRVTMQAPEMAGAATSQRDAGRSDPKFKRPPQASLKRTNSRIIPLVQTFDDLGGTANAIVAGLMAQRIAWLARKGRITPYMAAALAPLLFGEGGSQ
jgi:hypothetical protein